MASFTFVLPKNLWFLLDCIETQYCTVKFHCAYAVQLSPPTLPHAPPSGEFPLETNPSASLIMSRDCTCFSFRASMLINVSKFMTHYWIVFSQQEGNYKKIVDLAMSTLLCTKPEHFTVQHCNSLVKQSRKRLFANVLENRSIVVRFADILTVKP